MEALANLLEEQAKRRQDNRQFLTDHARTVRGLPPASPEAPKVVLSTSASSSTSEQRQEKVVREESPQIIPYPKEPYQEDKQESALKKYGVPATIGLATALAGLAGLHLLGDGDDTGLPTSGEITSPAESEGSFVDTDTHRPKSLLQTIEDERMHVPD